MTPATRKNFNFFSLKIFAPVLILTGVLGFLLPKEASLMSNASHYNIFHILSGIIGLICVFSKKLSLVKAFNIIFGIIDIYQALANWLKIFPIEYFKWTPADDVVHIVIGIALIFIGCMPDKPENKIE